MCTEIELDLEQAYNESEAVKKSLDRGYNIYSPYTWGNHLTVFTNLAWEAINKIAFKTKFGNMPIGQRFYRLDYMNGMREMIKINKKQAEDIHWHYEKK